MRKHLGTWGLVVGIPPPPSLISAQQKVMIKTIGLWDTLKKIPFFCVLMYKDKDQLSLSKSGVLKGELAVGRPAGASVLCLFPIPWPEAMVCIFRTTAGYRQAGDLSSGFITARKMTLASLWSQLHLWSAAKPLPLPANPTLFFCPRTPWLIAPNLSSVSVCTALPSRTAENQALPPCLLVGLCISRET